jgi:hypothetical protein
VNEVISRMYRENSSELSEQVRKRKFPGSKKIGEELKTEERKIAEAGEDAKAAADPERWYHKKWIMPFLGWALRTGLLGFFAFETFNAMAHEKSGCYLQWMNKDQEVTGHPVKLCQDATWPHKLGWTPNKTIKKHCNNCAEVVQWTTDRWAPEKVPEVLIKGGCTDIGSATKRACRKDVKTAGYNYRWDGSTWFNCLLNTFNAFTEDTASCITCLTKVAAMALSGGIASVIGIIIILIILWVIRWIYQNFFAGSAQAGGGAGPNIYLPPT